MVERTRVGLFANEDAQPKLYNLLRDRTHRTRAKDQRLRSACTFAAVNVFLFSVRFGDVDAWPKMEMRQTKKKDHKMGDDLLPATEIRLMEYP